LTGRLPFALAAAGSSGSPNALPITDGTASNGRNRMVVFSDSGDLGATAYVQLTPNDAEKIIYIRNSLSGSRSVILFQGTYNASNDYEVPAGTTAVVYFDGAGAGAVAANVFNNAYFDGLRLGSVSVTAILDEDNMASDSATALATQQSIKAYVDAQVGTVDTLAEILAIGNTTGATDIAVDSAQKVQFRDAAIYINSSVDGQLDIVADTEIQIAATTIDVNGALDVSGTALVTGVLTTTAATVSNGGGQFNGAINVGVDDTGYDVKFFGATAGAYMLWDESADDLILGGAAGLSVNSAALVTGVLTTTAATVSNGGGQFNGAINVGVDDTGYDVKFFGATAGAYMLWDESADDLILGGAAGLSVNSTALVTGVLTTTAATVSNGGGQFNGAINVGVDDTGYDVKFFGATAGKYMLWDESADTLEVSGTVVAAAGTALLPSITTTGDLNTGMWFPAADTIAFSEGGVEALRIDSSGNVGIGTSSPDAKLNIVGATGNQLRLSTSETEHYAIGRNDSTGYLDFYASQPSYTGYTFGGVDGERMRIDSSGNVGIGTSSPTHKLTVGGYSNVDAANKLAIGDNADYQALIYMESANETLTIENTSDYAGRATIFKDNGTERMRIDASGNVGIGMTPVASYGLLQVGSAVTSALGVGGLQAYVAGTNSALGQNGNMSIVTTDGQAANIGGSIGLGGKFVAAGTSVLFAQISGRKENGTDNNSAGYLQFATQPNGGTPLERMRIDSSGNLLVGTTSNNIYGGTTTGINLNPDGATSFNRASGQAAMFNRISTDGDIVQFRKDGTTVGSIGSYSGVGMYAMAPNNGGSGLLFSDNAAPIYPIQNVSGTATLSDGVADLGAAVHRFKDLYLSGGVYLGGTGSANHLDDYEEGTWTPTWIVASGSITANSNTSGRYTKIGRVVSIMGYISYESNSSASGAVTVGGLPFTSVTSGFGQSSNQAGGVTSFATVLFASNAPNVGRIDANNTIIRPNITGATGGTELQFSNFSLSTNHSQFVFQGQYIVNT
jgi:hypothetical protein